MRLKWIFKATFLFGLVSALVLNGARAEDTVLHTAVKLKVPKKSSNRTSGAADEVPISIWIPGDVKAVRGAIVNPFYLPLVERSDYQNVARYWKFALIGANFFGVKNDDFPALLVAMKEFAVKSGRPEIEHMPLCFNGMSAGAGMSVKFGEIMPERVIAISAVCLEVGPRTAEARKIPTITIFGERDGKQMEKLAAKLPIERAQGAQWAIAVQWGLRHDYANANWLVWPFFDRVIRYRLAGQTAVDGPIELREYREQLGSLGNPATWSTNWAEIGPSYKYYNANKDEACWFPDDYIAATWRAFVSKNPLVKIRVESSGKKVILAVEGNLPEDIKAVAFMDGNRLIGTAKERPFRIETDTVSTGVRALFAVYVYGNNKSACTRPVLILNGADPKSDAARSAVE